MSLLIPSMEGTFRATSQGQTLHAQTLPCIDPTGQLMNCLAGGGSRDVTSLVLAGRATSQVSRARAWPAELLPVPGDSWAPAWPECPTELILTSPVFRGTVTALGAFAGPHHSWTDLLHFTRVDMRKAHFSFMYLLLQTCFHLQNMLVFFDVASPADVSRVCVQLLIWAICMSRWFPLSPLGTGGFLSLLYFILIYRSKFKRAGVRVSHPDALPHPGEKLLVSVQLRLLASPQPLQFLSLCHTWWQTIMSFYIPLLTALFLTLVGKHKHTQTYTCTHPYMPFIC